MKDYILYSLKSEYLKTEEMCSGIGSYSEEQVFNQVGNLLHWLLDYADRVDFNNLNKQQRQVLKGIRFINNCLKHNTEIIDFKQKLNGCTTFPMKLDGSARFYCYAWADLSYLPSNSYRHKDQYDAYMGICKGLPIIITFRECMNIIAPNLVDEWINNCKH